MLTEEQAANAYEEVTDGCRHLVLGTRDNASQWQRVKRDEETNPLADLDLEKEPTWDQHVPQPRLLDITEELFDRIANHELPGNLAVTPP